MRRLVAALLGAIVIAGGMVATTGTALAAVPYCGRHAHWVRRVGCVQNRPTLLVRHRYHPHRHYYPPSPRPVHHPVFTHHWRNHA
jgi:hypothetical protein